MSQVEKKEKALADLSLKKNPSKRQHLAKHAKEIQEKKIRQGIQRSIL